MCSVEADGELGLGLDECGLDMRVGEDGPGPGPRIEVGTVDVGAEETGPDKLLD